MFWKPDRTVRFDRFNREPDQIPVQTVLKNRWSAELVENQSEPVKIEKTGEPVPVLSVRPVHIINSICLIIQRAAFFVIFMLVLMMDLVFL